MEKNSSALLHNGNRYLLKEFEKIVRFSIEENKILSARIEGDVSFEQMDDAEKKIFCNDVILSTSAFVGCNMPTTKIYLEMVLVMLMEFIDDGYSNLNFDEFLLALRLNMLGKLTVDGDVIQSTSQNFNLQYVATILRRYLVKRNIVDGKIKNTIDGR